jgi:hypothetical protein
MWEAGLEIVDGPGAFVEHYEGANVEVRQTNLETLNHDREAYHARWSGIFWDPEGPELRGRVALAYDDPHRTADRFPVEPPAPGPPEPAPVDSAPVDSTPAEPVSAEPAVPGDATAAPAEAPGPERPSAPPDTSAPPEAPVTPTPVPVTPGAAGPRPVAVRARRGLRARLARLLHA